MPEAKLIVIYPRPQNIEAFAKIYLEEHVPLAVAELIGKTKIVATKSPLLSRMYHSVACVEIGRKY
jgi:hypothetical protein